MELSKNARIILEERYLEKDKKGKVTEKPEELFRRVARNIALADKKYKEDAKKTEREFYELMVNLDFLPNSPTLFNAGKELQQLAACFVLPVEDDLDSIFQTLRYTARIHKSGGGTGFSFSRLRPKGDKIGATRGIASGPISFMKIFDCATEQIKQGGRRRGANMAVLRVDHPDIEEFITLKTKEETLGNFNLSVGITDKFMKAAEENRNYDLINPRSGKKTGSRKAREIFKLMARSAWKAAEPGMIFLDTINRKNPTPKIAAIESTNPCGEVPLLPYEACNLGSINLAHFAKSGRIDYPQLKEVVWKAVHFLDNVIEVSHYPFPEIDYIVKNNRKIGLGVMGFADLLAQLEISYASEEAVKVAEKIMKFINEEAKKASAALAEKRGVFANFGSSIYDTGRKEDRVRNATRTSVAPTGTISIIAGCSSGIEPLFALSYTRRFGEQKKFTEVNKYFLKKAGAEKLPQKTIARIIKKGSINASDRIPELKNIFAVAHQVPAEFQVKIQAAFQKHTDNAVSKTVNLPAKAKPEDIEKIYLLAHRLGCKGISVYRYGSREKQVLTVGKACKSCG